MKEYEKTKSTLSESDQAEREEELEFRRIKIKKQMLGNIKVCLLSRNAPLPRYSYQPDISSSFLVYWRALQAWYAKRKNHALLHRVSDEAGTN